jgi:hypothetical protein
VSNPAPTGDGQRSDQEQGTHGSEMTIHALHIDQIRGVVQLKFWVQDNSADGIVLVGSSRCACGSIELEEHSSHFDEP